ncbi:DUF5074 domain-containing protein [uncultured Rikenella sp.]|uniref:YncE family protein n=1 Tax=uncultured Rikenella sp. TaxID=368003 RepID=UPI00260B42C7|nr:DUF5074 domain-containing protein [uncultured Rikenella sp.]
MDYGPMDEEDFSGSSPAGDGVFVLCEGNFMYGNATLSYYIPSKKRVQNDIFSRANGIALGDVAQSMALHDSRGYLVINNSGVIFAIDTDTFRVVGTLTGLVSPRYVHFVSDTKAYVTDLYDSRITVFDPRTLEITGHIPLPGHKSAERMVQRGDTVFTNCWSYDNKILAIDVRRDEVVDSVTVGIQPNSLAIDRYGKLWAVTDGGYEGSPYGHEAPALWRIDAETLRIERRFDLPMGALPSELSLNGAGDTLYFLDRGVWRMPVEAEALPAAAFIPYGGTIYYGLGVDPRSSEIYVADAIDYVQPGVVYRFTPQGAAVDTFRVGIVPGAFCFK